MKKKLISVAFTIAFALKLHAQTEAYVPQYQEVSKPVVGFLTPSNAYAQPITVTNGTTATNSLVSNFALANGQVPPGEGGSWTIYGTTLSGSGPTNAFVLNCMVTANYGTNVGGFSVKVIQGRPYLGAPWQTIATVSNTIPNSMTNTATVSSVLSTNLVIPASTFFGFVEARVFSVQNTSTNTYTEQDQILYFH